MPGIDRLYHLADAANLPSILAAGLLSTAELAGRAGWPAAECRRFLRTHRPAGVELPGGVLVRDQKPMPPAALAPALRDGLTPADWYELVNGFVFLWPGRARLERHLGACGTRPQVLLTFDARRLLADLGHLACVSPFNVGNARRRAARRGLATLVPWHAWSAHGWPPVPGESPRHGPPAEIMVRGRVPAEAPYLIDAQPMARPS